MPQRLGLITRCLVMAVLVAIALWLAVRPERVLAEFAAWAESARGLGVWTDVVLFACYLPAIAFGLPVTLITPSVGFVLGPWEGFVVAMLGATAGSSLNYWISRTLLRKTVEGWAVGSRRLRALEIVCRTRGFLIVTLTRLTPAFPLCPSSYFYGVSSVPFGRYVLATLLGLAPRIALGVALGAAAKSLTETTSDAARHPPLWVAGVVLALTACICGVIVRIANRELREALLEAEGALAPPIEHEAA